MFNKLLACSLPPPTPPSPRFYASYTVCCLTCQTESQELDEYFYDLPPELCQLKIIGFSKDIGSSLSLLPSIMHRLENFLVAIELKHVLSASFPEGAVVSAETVRPHYLLCFLVLALVSHSVIVYLVKLSV